MQEYQKPELNIISVTQAEPVAFGFELSIPGFDLWD